MKRIILCFIMILFLGSCSLFDYEKILDEAINKISIDQKTVAYDFGLPKSVTVGSYALDINWESSSDLITIDKNAIGMYTARVDFISNKEQDTEVTLTAEVKLFSSSKQKEFVLTVPKYDLGSISIKDVNFENRIDIDGPLLGGCLSSIGSPKILVIPINLDERNKTDKVLNDINIAFNGTSEETGFESVKTYYQKSSYGKLNLDITVLDEWFTPPRDKDYYDDYVGSDGSDGSRLLLRQALDYYDSKINYNEYDTNDDQCIDAIWLIYNCKTDYYDLDSIYWAFQYYDTSDNTYDEKYAYYYAFAGIDFMHQTEDAGCAYDPTKFKVDACSYIHETGHLLGLDDYYDVDPIKGPEGGLYNADMMDYNLGDHSPISKLLLGWVTPTVVVGEGSVTVDLKSFTETGQFLIVTDRKLTSIYDTYYIVEFYTNTNLNKKQKPIDDYGVRITKINAFKNYVNGNIEFNDGDYVTGYKYDNSDEEELFIDLICDKKDIKYNDYSLSSKVLFTEGEVLNKPDIFFKLTVNTCEENGANITIEIS